MRDRQILSSLGRRAIRTVMATHHAPRRARCHQDIYGLNLNFKTRMAAVSKKVTTLVTTIGQDCMRRP
jgi:hypothetical protein